MSHYYIACTYKNKETSKIHQDLKPGVVPKFGAYKPDDAKIADEMAVIKKYLSEHIRMHGGITEVQITDANGKIPKAKEAKK